MEQSPKYYRGISPVPKEVSAPEHERTHQQYASARLTGRLHGTLVAFQPLHVGSGLLVRPEDVGLPADETPLLKAWMREDSLLVIPGSSLKGVFRSLVELYTESCVCKTREGSQHNECRYDSKKHEGTLCPACKLFGAMGYQGQVRFADAACLTAHTALYFLPPQFKPHVDAEDPKRRYYPHDLVDPRPDANWPMEVVVPGATFALEGQFTNLAPAELGVLLIALGQGPWALCPKVGAGKSCGLGGVRIQGLQVEQVDPVRAYTTLDDSAAWSPVDMESCIEAADPLCRSEVLQILARDLACPEVAHG